MARVSSLVSPADDLTVEAKTTGFERLVVKGTMKMIEQLEDQGTNHGVDEAEDEELPECSMSEGGLALAQLE